MPTEESRNGQLVGLQSACEVSLKEAEELAVLGQWFVNECNGPEPAVSRISRKLHRLAGAEGLAQVMAVISQIADATNGAPSQKQLDALSDIKVAFKV